MKHNVMQDLGSIERTVQKMFSNKNFKSSLQNDVLIDIKTTSNIDKFKWSSRDYNYDSQAYIYQQIFGKPVIFYVVCKVSGRLGIFKPTEQFLIGGREKVQKAIEIYNNFFIENAKMEITQHITEEDL